MQSSRYLISFSYDNLQVAGIDGVFFWINPVEKCTLIFSAVLSQQRQSDVIAVFWSLCSQRHLL
jgi:hypothetical protein